MTQTKIMYSLKDSFAESVLNYYKGNKRILPWRDTGNPYYTWLSEIMLQQTRVEAVKSCFLRFIQELPTVEDLANCEEERLLKLWEGLGYYTRVRNLQKAAKQIVEEHDGVFPQTKKELLTLAGIGDYTASAIASISFGEDEVALDGNLIRVFSRVFALEDDFTKVAGKKELIAKIEALIPSGKAGDFNQAIMDIGATICLPNGRPLCEKCPIATMCKANLEQTQVRYPIKKPKKARKLEKRTILILCKGEQIIMRKRKEKGVLQGLWEFPNVQGHLDKNAVREILTGELLIANDRIKQIEESCRATHIFSHLEWDMHSFWVDLRESEESKGELSLRETKSLYKEGIDLRQEAFSPTISLDEAQEMDGVWLSAINMEEDFSIPSAFRVFQNEIFRRLSKKKKD